MAGWEDTIPNATDVTAPVSKLIVGPDVERPMITACAGSCTRPSTASCSRTLAATYVSPVSERPLPFSSDGLDDVPNNDPGPVETIWGLVILSRIGTTTPGATDGTDRGTTPGVVRTGVTVSAGVADKGTMDPVAVTGVETTGVTVAGLETGVIKIGATEIGVVTIGVVRMGVAVAADAAVCTVALEAAAADDVAVWFVIGAKSVVTARAAMTGSAVGATDGVTGFSAPADGAAAVFGVAKDPLSAWSAWGEVACEWPACCELSPRPGRPPPSALGLGWVRYPA